MISTIELRLCDYADALKKGNVKTGQKAVRECLNIMHEVFRDAEKAKIALQNGEANSEIEALVMGVPTLKAYRDPVDGQRFYDLCGLHFDSPAEVIQYIIDSWAMLKSKQVRKPLGTEDEDNDD